MSCGTQVSPGFLKTVSPTGLSPSAAALPFAFGYRFCHSLSAILQPRAARRHAPGLGSSAFARHYSRNHCYFLFLRVLRCFSSPRSPSALSAVTASLPPGFPIRTSAVRAGICPSPPLFAACHVLLRLREPQASPMRPSLLSFFLFAFFRPAAASFQTRLLDSSVRLLFVFSYLFFSRLRLQRLCLVSDLLVHHVNDLSISLSRSPRQS